MRKQLILLLISFIFISCEDDLDPVSKGTVFIMAKSDFYCSALEYSPGIILTAAHCVEEDRSWIYLNSRRKKIKKMIVHPGWDSQKVVNDIAIIVLKEYSLDSSVKFFEGYPVRGDEFKTISIKESTRFHKYHTFVFSTHEKLAAIDNSHEDSVCKGDSGSPAYIVHDKVHYLLGITSGISGNMDGECNDGGYSVFVSIEYMKEWFLSEISQL